MARLSAPLPTNVSPTLIGLTLGDALDRWYAYMDAADRIAPRTVRAYRYATDKAIAHFGADYSVSRIDSGHIESLFAALKADGLSPSGRRAVFTPLRTFFTWCVKRGLLPSSPMADVEPPVVRVQPVQFVDDVQWAAILATCASRSRHDFRAVRDRAILLVLASTGGRLHEVAGLVVGDLDLRNDVLTVHGKGGKDRVLPILPDVREALLVYMTRGRARSPYKALPDLWLGSKGAMTDSGIAQMLAERGKAAGIPRRVHPHELRHRAIAGWLGKGMPGPLVQALSGHATPSMLNRYGAYTRSQDAMAMLRQFEGRAS